MSAAIQTALVDALRRVPASDKPHLGEIRRAIAAELGACSPAELAAAVQSLRYQGKLSWDGLDLAESMQTAGANNSAAPAAEGGAAAAKVTSPPSTDVRKGQPAAGDHEPPAAGPDDDENDEDYPGQVNDVGDRPIADAAARSASGAQPNSSAGAGFVPKPLLHKVGVHAAQTRAGARPVPAPEHEPEIARQIREEATATAARRYRANSTGTVRQPLELRKFGVPDLSFAEGMASLLVENPNDLMAAISRKHPVLWRRVLLLARALDQRPAQALYDVIEHGLAELEAEMPPQANAA